MRDSSNDDDGKSKVEEQQGTRRHLYTGQLPGRFSTIYTPNSPSPLTCPSAEHSRQSMSTLLESNLVSGSISASLAEIDHKTRDAEHPPGGDIVIGPFGVLDFGSTEAQKDMQDSQTKAPKQLEPGREAPQSPPQTASAAGQETQELPALINNSPSYIDDFLHWSDILGLSPEQPGFFQPSMLDLDTYLADPVPESFAIDMNVGGGAEPRSMAIPTPPSSAMEMASTFLDAAALADAPYLFKHFNENVVPQMVIMPLGDKSPWRILNLSTAMATYNDLTILGSQSISHARLANLYALLACSAVHLSTSHGSTGSAHWQQASAQMFEQARDHMQKSLKLETREPKRAKYKDQLMAVCCLIQYTVSGHPLPQLARMLR
jgi:arginine metabolism regulation protein II